VLFVLFYFLIFQNLIFTLVFNLEPVTVAERSRAYTVFAFSEAGTVGSNSTQGMDVYCLCMCVRFSVCVQVEALR
jgi:hypothetical protein